MKHSGVEICADRLGDALLDEAEQFGFDLVGRTPAIKRRWTEVD
jgi:hypothetical protein